MEQAMEARTCTGRCGLGAPSEKLFSLSSAFVTTRVTTRQLRCLRCAATMDVAWSLRPGPTGPTQFEFPDITRPFVDFNTASFR